MLDAFAAPDLWAEVARNAPVLSRPLLDRLETQRRVAVAVVDNPALATDLTARARVAAWLPHAYEAELDRRTFTPGARARQCNTTYHHDVGAALVTLAGTPGGLTDAVRPSLEARVRAEIAALRTPGPCLVRALVADVGTSPSTMAALGVSLRDGNLFLLWLTHPVTTPAMVADLVQSTEAQGRLVDALTADADGALTAIRPDIWRAILGGTQRQADRLARLLHDPRTTLDDLRWAASLDPDPVVKAALATHPVASRDPGIREALQTSRRSAVLRGLMEGATAAEFPLCFRRYAAIEPGPALTWLETRGAPAGTSLTQQDVLPLLASKPNANVRDRVVRTMALLATIDGPADRPGADDATTHAGGASRAQAARRRR
jgi:hypothetical protein